MAMETVEIAVLLGGISLIGLTLWYFFAPHRAVAAAGGGSGVQEIRIVVKGGFAPDVVRVEAGRPVRLLFDRRERGSCTDEVVFPGLGISKALPAFRTTPVEFTPEAPGDVPFSCGMRMLHGMVRVGRAE
jgi:P-type Cu+ transporter